jgi:hypothetical protein
LRRLSSSSKTMITMDTSSRAWTECINSHRTLTVHSTLQNESQRVSAPALPCPLLSAATAATGPLPRWGGGARAPTTRFHASCANSCPASQTRVQSVRRGHGLPPPGGGSQGTGGKEGVVVRRRMMRRRNRRRKDVTVKGVPPKLNPEHRVEPDGPFIEQCAYHRIGNLRPRHVRSR